MKKSNKLLTLSLGLVLGLGALAACTNTTTPTTSVAAPTTSSQAPTSAPTSEPTSAPTSAPTTSEAPTTSVAPSTSAPTSEAPSTSVSDFVAETARWFIVGGYEGASWDGDAATIPADRTLVLNESKLAEELNIHEATIARINKDQTFRLIKSDNGVASNGWTSAYGYAQVTKVLDAEGNELNLADYIDVDNGYGNDNNIKWVGKDAKIKVSYDSDANEITLQIIDEFSFVAPTSIGAIGDFGTSNWNTEVEFTANNDGTIWTATVTFEAGKEWKVRKNDNWSTSYGFDSLVSYPDGAFSGEGSSNIKAVTGGTYELEFDAVEGKIKAVEVIVEEPKVDLTATQSFSFAENGLPNGFFTVAENATTKNNFPEISGTDAKLCLKMDSKGSLYFEAASAGTFTLKYAIKGEKDAKLAINGFNSETSAYDVEVMKSTVICTADQKNTYLTFTYEIEEAGKYEVVKKQDEIWAFEASFDPYFDLTPSGLFNGIEYPTEGYPSYATYNGEHVYNGVTFVTNQVMESRSFYSESSVLQMQSEKGSIIANATTAQKVTIVLVDTYTRDASKFVVTCGDKTATGTVLSTEATGLKNSKGYEFSIYTIEYTFDEVVTGDIKIANTKNAVYALSVTID